MNFRGAALEVAHDVNLAVLCRAAHPRVLSALLDRVRCDPDLFATAEHFDNIDQIVLYDALDRGFGPSRVKARTHPGTVHARRRASRRFMSIVIDHSTICSCTARSVS
ncbi:hypothetical protein P3T36_007881 [Kitasatospora sp. MAP12-15]|nr:hypothetical protein [Kitasatospora sp. MAP12-44]